MGIEKLYFKNRIFRILALITIRQWIFPGKSSCSYRFPERMFTWLTEKLVREGQAAFPRKDGPKRYLSGIQRAARATPPATRIPSIQELIYK